MAHVQPVMRVELDPLHPVQEICAVISALLPYHPGKEADILRGVQQAVDKRLKEVEAREQVREHTRVE